MRISFAIIGCGNIGRRHAEQITSIGHLAAVCDIVVSKAEGLGKKYDAPVFTSIEELLTAAKDVDVVCICTPNGLHASQSIKSLRAGYHVLCEKPMAISSADCKAMINEANRAGKQLFVVKQNRFNPPVVAVKKILDEKRLGKIYSIQLNCFWNRDVKYYERTWKGSQELDGGTLFTQFSHFIDLLYWMIGDVKNVDGFRKNFAHKNIIEFEDSGVVILEFENGVIGTINYTINSFEKNMEGSLTIFAEKGTVKIGGQYLNVLEYQRFDNYEIGDLPTSSRANDYGFYEGSMSNHDRVYQNVVDVLNNKAPIAVGSFEGLKTVEIIEKIYAASKFLN